LLYLTTSSGDGPLDEKAAQGYEPGSLRLETVPIFMCLVQITYTNRGGTGTVPRRAAVDRPRVPVIAQHVLHFEIAQVDLSSQGSLGPSIRQQARGVLLYLTNSLGDGPLDEKAAQGYEPGSLRLETVPIFMCLVQITYTNRGGSGTVPRRVSVAADRPSVSVISVAYIGGPSATARI